MFRRPTLFAAALVVASSMITLPGQAGAGQKLFTDDPVLLAQVVTTTRVAAEAEVKAQAEAKAGEAKQPKATVAELEARVKQAEKEVAEANEAFRQMVQKAQEAGEIDQIKGEIAAQMKELSMRRAELQALKVEAAGAAEQAAGGNAAAEAAKQRADQIRREAELRHQRMMEARQRMEQEHRVELEKAELNKITLPEQPTRADVVRYVTALVRSADKLKRRQSTDPQVKMLQKVPTEHFDVLLREDLRMMRGHSYIRYALQGPTAERFKAQIIDAVVEHSWLVSVVSVNKWTEDAAPQFVKAVNSDPLNVSTTVIRYAVTADGPGVRDALIERLIAGQSRSSTYSYLSRIDNNPVELDTAVALAWEQVNRDPNEANERRALLYVAMQHGHLDAVDEAVERYRTYADRLKNPKLNKASRDSTERLLRQRVVDHFAYSGDVGEFYAWYDRVKDELEWDRVARKYCVPVLG